MVDVTPLFGEGFGWANYLILIGTERYDRDAKTTVWRDYFHEKKFLLSWKYFPEDIL